MDFHCHIDLYPNAKEVYAEACRRNEFTWLVTTSPRAFVATSKVLGKHPSVMITPGLHPEIAHERSDELSLLLEQIKHSKAVGEVGLDGSPRFKRYLQLQQKIFSAVVVESAANGGRVISIHSRQAVKEVLNVLAEYPDFGTAILHWFSGSQTDLREAAAQGCWFSVGPAMFSSANARALIKNMPMDRVIAESDGPFAQYRKSTVMPWDIHLTTAELCQVWDCPEAKVKEVLAENGNHLLDIINWNG